MLFKTKRIVALFSAILLLTLYCCPHFFANAAEHTAAKTKAYIDSIISYKVSYEKESSVQSLIDKVFVKQAGIGAEWYILSLKQYKYSSLDYSSYTSALEKYVSSPNAGNPVEKEKYALILSCLGRGQAYAPDIIEESTGKLGLMSYIYSLHLLNLGFKAKSVTKSSVIATILDRQLSDGGWAVSGSVSDIDATAMAIQALSQNLSDKKVRSAVEKAVTLLSKRSDADNEYSSYGIINSESVAQVIIAISSMGIDCCKDNRFIKNGKNLIDVLLSYKKSDSSYSHTHSDSGSPYPTVQALMAFVSYYRLLNSQGSLYKFDTIDTSVKPSVPNTAATSQPQTTTSKSKLDVDDVLGKLDVFNILGSNSNKKAETTSSEYTTAATTIASTIATSEFNETAPTVPTSAATTSPQTQDSLYSSQAQTASETEASSNTVDEAATLTVPSEDIFQEASSENSETDKNKDTPSIFISVVAVSVILVVSVIFIRKRIL